MRTTCVPILLCSLLLCTCSSFSGPSNSAVHDAVEKLFTGQAPGNPYYKICSGDLKINVLNKEVQGNEAMVRAEITWNGPAMVIPVPGSPPPGCELRTTTFTFRFVNRDGTWVLAQ